MEMLTVAQVASRLALSESTVRREIKSGRMRAVVRRGMSRGLRVSVKELDRWAREEWLRPSTQSR